MANPLNGHTFRMEFISSGLNSETVILFSLHLLIYLKVSQRVLNVLQMIPQFFQWFMILQHLQHFLMITSRKFLVGHAK